MNGLWYRAFENKYGLNRESIKVQSRGVYVWRKDICNKDYGGVESHNVYSFKEVYKWSMSSFLQKKKWSMSNLSSSSDSTWSRVWHKSVLLKVQYLVWRLFQNRLAIRDNLFQKRSHGSKFYSLCGRIQKRIINISFVFRVSFELKSFFFKINSQTA